MSEKKLTWKERIDRSLEGAAIVTGLVLVFIACGLAVLAFCFGVLAPLVTDSHVRVTGETRSAEASLPAIQPDPHQPIPNLPVVADRTAATTSLQETAASENSPSNGTQAVKPPGDESTPETDQVAQPPSERPANIKSFKSDQQDRSENTDVNSAASGRKSSEEPSKPWEICAALAAAIGSLAVYFIFFYQVKRQEDSFDEQVKSMKGIADSLFKTATLHANAAVVSAAKQRISTLLMGAAVPIPDQQFTNTELAGFPARYGAVLTPMQKQDFDEAIAQWQKAQQTISDICKLPADGDAKNEGQDRGNRANADDSGETKPVGMVSQDHGGNGKS